jgi:DNA-directed RNA polymerase specialized sigma24 family protein
VFDRDAPSTKRVLEELKKPRGRPRLFRLAWWRTHSKHDADDLVQQTLECVCDPERRPWDPARKTFLIHISDVMRDILYEQGRSARAMHEVVDSTLARDDATVDGAPLADEALDAHRELARLQEMREQLLADLGDRHPIATKALRLAMTGVVTPAEQAGRIPCAVEDLYEAYRVLKYHGALILAERQEAEARQMRERREKAKNEEVAR